VPPTRIKPARLKSGSGLGVVAPASPLYNRGDIARARARLEIIESGVR
jgi:muramoyltetrapeptide carboxypeptidase LdcA involved in peptidoglycan recycling